jgi:hypothetical protein
MMKKPIGIILILLFVFTLGAFAQERKASTDTAATELKFDLPALPFSKPDLSLPLSLKLITSDYSPEYLRASLTAPPSLTEKANREIQGIWQRELTQQNEGKTWRTILSFLQTGGTAYLLYEHIHKYGLK